MRRTLAALAVLTIAGCAELNETLKQIPQTSGNVGTIGDVRIGAALKEALQVGTENAVKLTGRPDGYFRNERSRSCSPSSCGRSIVGSAPSASAARSTSWCSE